MEASSLLPIAWVQKRDGRLEPFEPDRICQALFAAGERLGSADAFLARELTDGVLHFLAAEGGSTPPTTDQITELVVKVVRELGQPALARAYQEGRGRERLEPEGSPLGPWVEAEASPVALAWRAAGEALRAYALRAVFSRDLASAHGDGLVALTGLEAPFEMAGVVIPPGSGGLLEAVEAARGVAGEFLAVDAPEYELAREEGLDAGAYARELSAGLRLTGLRAVVNLNAAAPPRWADDLAEGPLFAGHRREETPERLQAVAETLREALAGGPVRVDWHLAERDFTPAALPRLTRVLRDAAEGADVAFAFDRPRRPVALADGLDRRHPALLTAVGLHLPELLRRTPAPNAEAFVGRLGSLARLALSAARQKRDFLRRHASLRPGIGRGFVLDRARLAVIPLGLDAVVRALTGEGVWDGPAGLALAHEILGRLQDSLRQDGRSCGLETTLAAVPEAPEPLAVARGRLRAAAWYAYSDMGTVRVALPEEEPPRPEGLAEFLRQLWRQTDVVRVAFTRPVRAHQMVAAWDDGLAASPRLH